MSAVVVSVVLVVFVVFVVFVVSVVRDMHACMHAGGGEEMESQKSHVERREARVDR